MEKVIDYLKQLELSELEAKLYLTLLQTGPITVRELAEKIYIKRTTAYLYVDQLVEKGLVMKIVQDSKKLVAAEEPKNLEHLVEEKVAHAKDVQHQFPNLLKTLSTFTSDGNDVGDADIKYYKGQNSIKKIYEDALKGSELRLYVNLSEVAPLFVKEYDIFDKALHLNPKLKIFEIYGDQPESIKQLSYTSKSDRFFYKFMPAHVKLTAACILIYDNKVAIINVRDKKNISGVILQSIDYYNNSKELFDFIWGLLPQE